MGTRIDTIGNNVRWMKWNNVVWYNMMNELNCEQYDRCRKAKNNLAAAQVPCRQCEPVGIIEAIKRYDIMSEFDSLFLATDIYYMKALVR